MATPFGLDLSWWGLQALQWGAALATGLMVRGFGHRPWHVAAAWVFISVPLWEILWNILDDLAVLLDPDSVVLPYSRRAITWMTATKLVEDIGYVGVGAIIWASGGSWRRAWRLDITAVAAWAAARGVPSGKGEGHGAWMGLLWFPVLLAFTVGGAIASEILDVLQNGQEEGIWRNMTWPFALLLAAAAGFGEELVYRGVLMTTLRRVVNVPAAVVGQAVVFGFAHAGFGTWEHLAAALAFGLVAGGMAMRWGLWAPIVMHVLIDVYAWGPDAAADAPWFGALLALFLAANVIVSITAALAWTVARRRQRGPGTPDIT